MSDTPRTDAVSVECSGHKYRECVDTDFARQLERELAAKQAEIDRLMLEFAPEEMTEAQTQNIRVKRKKPEKQQYLMPTKWVTRKELVKMFPRTKK